MLLKIVMISFSIIRYLGASAKENEDAYDRYIVAIHWSKNNANVLCPNAMLTSAKQWYVQKHCRHNFLLKKLHEKKSPAIVVHSPKNFEKNYNISVCLLQLARFKTSIAWWNIRRASYLVFTRSSLKWTEEYNSLLIWKFDVTDEFPFEG